MKAAFAVIVSITVLCSEITSGQDFGMLQDLVRFGFGVVQECAKANNVGLVKIVISLAVSHTADKNIKCAIACMMENFYLIIDSKVETGLLNQVIDAIPIEAVKVPVSELITMCEKKGNGPNKCENANTFIMCLKQNVLSVVAKAVMQG